MPSRAHQTAHKVEERISELGDKSRELCLSTETKTQREKKNEETDSRDML